MFLRATLVTFSFLILSLTLSSSAAVAAERSGLTLTQGIQACIAESPSNDHDTMMLGQMLHLGMVEEIEEVMILRCQLFMSCLWRQGSISYEHFVLWRDQLCHSQWGIFY